MDVYGKSPLNEKGAYFRNNVWWWRPLWDYCESVYAPCNEVDGHCNGGEGLSEEQAAELSRILLVKLESGEVKRHKEIRDLQLSMLPEDPCEICKGTGQRPDGLHGVEWKQDGCNGCNGTGTRPSWETNYPFDEENVREFAEFCALSGGFEIW